MRTDLASRIRYGEFYHYRYTRHHYGHHPCVRSMLVWRLSSQTSYLLAAQRWSGRSLSSKASWTDGERRGRPGRRTMTRKSQLRNSRLVGRNHLQQMTSLTRRRSTLQSQPPTRPSCTTSSPRASRNRPTFLTSRPSRTPYRQTAQRPTVFRPSTLLYYYRMHIIHWLYGVRADHMVKTPRRMPFSASVNSSTMACMPPTSAA